MSSAARSAASPDAAPSKVPHVAVGFWIAKILATTLGETGGDALSMGEDVGYGISTCIFLGVFAVTAATQIAVRRYHPLVYWLVVITTTTAGTTLSDYLDRTLGLGYAWSSLGLFIGVLVVLAVWRAVIGRIAFEGIASRREEAFYWLTILVANTLGTALGDFTADAGLGFAGGAAVFAGLLLVVVAAHFWLKRIPASALFWAAYVLTRPLGATVGDILTKPHEQGGLHLSQLGMSLVIAAAMAVVVTATWLVERRRPA